MLVRKIEDLEIYRLAFQLACEITNLIKPIAHRWDIKEIDQIKRSSSSVPANTTEGFSNRFYTKKYLHYLNIALGSSDETQNHLKKLGKDGHIDIDLAYSYANKYKTLSIKILNWMNRIKSKHH